MTNNETIAPVDVLAVMDAVQAQLDRSHGVNSFPELREARAAVAELVEAAKFMRRRFADEPDLKFSQRSAVRKLDAALAKCGGAK